MPATETVRAPITGAVLAWARQVGGFTQEDLAAAIGRPGRDDIIARWENEEDAPTSRQLSTLSGKLKRPIATFFLPKPPSEPDPTATFKRSLSVDSGDFSPELRLAIRATRYARDRFVDLLADTGNLVQCKIPHATVSNRAEEVAAEVRAIVDVSVGEQLRWPTDDAYRRWSEALVRVGVLPQFFEVDPEQAWGFSITDGDMPVAAVNRKISAKNARVFTLWHEVGHVVLRQSSVSVLEPGRGGESVDTEERFCNHFAAAFLMPIANDSVKLAIRGFDGREVSEDTVSKVARRFKVSKYVVLGRLLASNVVSLDNANVLRRTWWAGDSAREKERRERERARAADSSPKIPRWKTAIWDRGDIVVDRALNALSRGQATTSTVSDLLGIRPQDIEKVERSLSRGGE